MSVAAAVPLMESIIAGTEPSYLPSRAFTRASGAQPLDETPIHNETTRSFHVIPEPPDDLGDYIGSCWEVWGTVMVEVAYTYDPGGYVDAYQEMRIMMSQDAVDIVKAVTNPPAGAQWDGQISGCPQFMSGDVAEKSDTIEGLWITRVYFRWLVPG